MQPLRQRALLLFAVACALLLLAAISIRMLQETGGTNSYALVADSLLNLRPYVTGCFDADCAVRDGHTYVVFPPLPGVVAMPLVAAFGTGMAGFTAIGLLAFALSLWLWKRIFARLQSGQEAALWLLLAVGFASPLFFVTLRAEKVWFFAQCLAFLFVTLALHEALARRLASAGLAIGLAFLCRQMSIFYAPVLLLLTLRPEDPLVKITTERLRNALLIALPVVGAMALYFAYNYWRFGNPLDTGYSDIAFSPGMLKDRTDQYGLWNLAYVPFNLSYLLVQGFHVEFTGPQQLSLQSLDSNGTGLLAASPWLLLLFFTPLRRLTVIGWLMILGFAGALLFYHSNGFSQYNTQRYSLDWLPMALIMLAQVFDREAGESSRTDMLKLLVAWGLALNVVAVTVLALTHAA